MDTENGRLERVRIYDRVAAPLSCALCDSESEVVRGDFSVKVSTPDDHYRLFPKLFRYFVRKKEQEENKIVITIPLCENCPKTSVVVIDIDADERWMEIFATPKFCSFLDPNRDSL